MKTTGELSKELKQSHEDLRVVKKACQDMSKGIKEFSEFIGGVMKNCNPDSKTNMNDHIRIDFKDLFSRYVTEVLGSLSKQCISVHNQLKDYGNTLKEFEEKGIEFRTEYQNEVNGKTAEVSRVLRGAFIQLHESLFIPALEIEAKSKHNHESHRKSLTPKDESKNSPLKGDLTPKFAPTSNFFKKDFETSKREITRSKYCYPLNEEEVSSTKMNFNMKLDKNKIAERSNRKDLENKSTSSSHTIRPESDKGDKSPNRNCSSTKKEQPKLAKEQQKPYTAFKNLCISEMIHKAHEDNDEETKLRESKYSTKKH